MKEKKKLGRTRRQRKSRAAATRKFVPPHSAEELFTLPAKLQDRYQRMTHAVTKMRFDKLSLSRVAQMYEISPKDIQRLGGRALRKKRNGRYAAKRRDTLLRPLMMVSQRDLEEIFVNDSDQATRIAKHSNAVSLYLRTGDALPLQEFEGEYAIDANGNRIPFLTDLKELDRRGSAGNLSFESLYARAS